MGWFVWWLLIMILMAFLMPWWFIPMIVLGGILYFILANADTIFRKREPIDNSMPHLEKVKREIAERKRREAERAKRMNEGHDNGKTMVKKSDVVKGAAAIAGGAALYHHLTKEDSHEDVRYEDNNTYGDHYIDADYDDSFDESYDNAYDDAIQDDLDAYDDFLASLDD